MPSSIDEHAAHERIREQREVLGGLRVRDGEPGGREERPTSQPRLQLPQ